jgi:hypothetical protein
VAGGKWGRLGAPHQHRQPPAVRLLTAQPKMLGGLTWHLPHWDLFLWGH